MRDLTIDPVTTNPSEGVKLREPTTAETVQFALGDALRGETEQSKAQKADMLGRVYLDLLGKAQRGVPADMNDDDARAEAVYFSSAMTGQDDVYGKLWRKGGFKTGREYLTYMQDFFLNAPERNKTQKLRDFEAMDEEGQIAEAMKERKTLDKLKHAIGEGYSYALDWLHRADTDKVASEHQLKEWMYSKQVRAAHHAELLAENAWVELSGILPRLSEDGRECAQALMDSKDNRLPETMYAKFNNLPDDEKQMIVRARTVLKPYVPGGFWNTIGDMAIGAANVAANVAAAPYRFGNKLAMAANDDIFDVNELAKRKQYLWQAAGRFTAGGAEGGYLPQMQFEQICEDHGFVAESLIGAVSTLPYMAAAAVPYVGVATVALEAMNEMDDHVAMQGGDITDPDYIFSSALFGAMYAYTERLQVEGLLGAVGDRQLREAMLKGFFKGIRSRAALRTLTAGTLAESLQEGMQNGIMAANEALALDQDATRAFAEGFTEDFVNSLGTMFVVEAGGLVVGHAKRSGFNNPFTASGREAGREARSTDLESEYQKFMCQDRMVEYAARSEELRAAVGAAEAFRLFRTWEQGGREALVKAGVDPVRAEEFDYFYSSTREGLAQDEETGEAAPDIRWQKAQQSIAEYIAHEAMKRTKSGESSDLAAFDLAMTNLDWVRSAWSEGAGIRRTDEEGKVQDPGAKALQNLGFSKEVASRLSEYFHKERSAAYSPAALNGIKTRYETRMEGKVTAKAAIAQQFGGQLVRFDGADYLQFTGKDGINLVRIDETPGGIDFAEASEGVAVDVERATEGKVTKAQWLAATPEQRKTIWNDYGLVHEGAFTQTPAIKVTIPADPSVGVDSTQAATIVGTITLDSQTDNRQIADTSAGFHEVYHAFSAFAQASGLWTKEDVAFLEKKFGKPKHSQETHDEEAAAEGFRSFLARRANGALTVEDERSPFARIYAAAAGLDARAREMAAQEKVASESEQAFFHQLIAEQNKPKPKPNPPAPKPNLPTSVAPQRGIKPGTGNGERGTETAKTETQTSKTETGNGERGTKTAETESVQPGAPKTWSAYTPTGNVKVSGHWAVLDLKDVVHSNNPLYAVHMRAQLRNRKDNKAEEDTRKDIVNNFQGERLLDAPDTANGAPIVFYDDDGTGVKRAFVLSGNGRVLVLNELADRHLYDHYRNVMKKWAAANGIEVPDGQTPILVRVIDDYGGASRDKVADLSNTNSIQQYTEEEQARADAEVIKALGLAKLYQANVDGTPDMTPGANDEFFSEFIRGVGDTSLYNSDRSLTQTARDRAQRALLAIAVGQGDRGRSVVKKLVEQTETLGIQRQKNAAAIMAAPVAALESNATYAIGPDVSRAMADFMDYAEKRKAGKVGTFKEYFDQMDLLDAPSEVARELLKLFGSDKSAATIAEYVRAYCKAAAMEDPAGGLFGAARTKDEIWNDAAKLVDDTIAKQQGVEQKTQPKQEQKKPEPKQPALQKGSVSIAPAADTPRPAKTPTGTVTYTINPQKGGPVTSTMPAGAFGDLRGPYDPYERTPEAKNPVRSIFSGTATRQLDPQGKYWGDKMPQFMGHKTEMFDRTVMTLRQKLGPEELAKFDTVVDYFGGGCWGMSLALATMPNVKRIIVNEFDPGRAKKIELLQTLGKDIADEAEKMFKETGVYGEMFDRLMTAGDDGGESGSGATMANVIIRNFKDRLAEDPRKLGLMYAVTDCASRQLAGSRDVRDPSTGETTKVKISAAERWAKVKEQLSEDGKNATAMRKAIEARGGKVEYVNGDSTKPDFGVGFDVPHGGNVMAVADPPYYRTEGYSDDGSSWKVGLEKIEGGYGYANTGEFLKSLVDNGDGIVYTDEAWWLKPEYLETHRVHSDGLFDDAEILAANPEFRRENEILQGIRDIFDHFDVAGKVAGRYETLGVHHGKETGNAGSERRADERQGSGVLHGGAVGSADDDTGRQGDGRQSIRRLAGGAEGEDDALLRTGGGSRQEGIRREDAVRQIDAALKDALPPGMAGYPGQATMIENLARHSVRQVREERIWEYAGFVGRIARKWIANAEQKLDKRMREAGYTEKVWHGTYGKDFNVFKFSAKSHDVPAAYFTYNRGTAQNYAALNGEGDLEDQQDYNYNTRQFYINPGKKLEWDEAEKPTSFAQFVEKMKKAYEDGYNSVIVRNALDDAGLRLDEYDNGPVLFLEPGEVPGDGEGTFQTDILIVMQQPGDNAPARIKAADPVTFADDELPIPLEMRVDQTLPDVRYSVQMGKNAREEVRRMIEKYHPWRFDGERDEDIFGEGELEKYIEQSVDHIAAFETPKERKAALLWFCKDTIRLPEDSAKVTEAIKTAERAKVDPMQYERPGEILTKFADYRPKEKPIDPDTVPELSDKRELGDGIVTYLVQDDKAGQAAMRRIINTHFGKDANPWCLLQGNGKGNLSDEAWHYWQNYSAIPKRVAFRNGKLIAFMATSGSSVMGGREEAEIRYEEAIENGDEIPDREAWIREQLQDPEAAEEWWDRNDESHEGIPFTRNSTDAKGAKITENVELMPDGKERVIKRANTQTKPDGSKVTTTEKLDENDDVAVVTRHTEYVDGSSETVETYGDVEETIWNGPAGNGSLDVVTLRGQIYSFNAHDNHYGSVKLQPYNNIIVWRNAGREEYISKREPTTVAALTYLSNAMSAVRRGDPIPPPPTPDRHSIERGWKDAKPMTAAEIARTVEEVGTTKDPKNVAYITPDGKWLDYDNMGEHADIRWSFSPKHLAQLDKLLIDEGDATPYIAAALKAGLVRVTGGIFTETGAPVELGVQFAGRPNARMLDDIERYFKTVDRRYPETRRLVVECSNEDNDADWSRQYEGGESDRIMHELSEFARTGEPPPETGRSIVAQFHTRDAIYASGRYYGTGLREIAHGLKRGDKSSISKAASLMALNVPPKAVLVPMPGHEGPATTMLPLAEAIAKRVEGATVVDALVAEPHESNYTHKQRAHRPVKVVMHRTDAKIPKGRPVLVVDNVIASGATYRAAQDAIPGADLLTLADAGRETRGQREQMRHSVFMGFKGSVFSGYGLQRFHEADDMARAHGQKAISKSRKWYTPKVRDEIYAKTGWWLGTDGKWRIEIPDMKPKKLDALQDGDFKGELAHPVELTELVSNTRLFKAYSELKHVTVWFIDPDSDEMEGLAGMLSGDNIVMTWDDLTNLDPEDGEIKLTYEGMQVLTHEVQHYVQWLEGFASGGSQEVNGKRNYPLLAGEVEARNAERRYGGPFGTLVSARQDEATRREMIEHGTAPWQTEDVPTLKQLISKGDGKQTDINGKPVARHSISTTAQVEADARRAISAYAADGGAKAANDALENYVAYFKLAHGSIPKPKTLARIGLSLGMNVVDPKRILKNAEKIAEQMKGSIIERASQNGDVATAMTLIKREKDLANKMEDLLAGSVELGGKLTHKGVGQINSLLKRRIDSMMRGFTAASLADMEGDTGLDLAAEILANNPDAFDTEYRRAKSAAGEQEETGDDGNAGNADENQGAAAELPPIDESGMSDADRYKRDILMKEAAERVARFIEAAKARAEANGAKAAADRERRRVVEVGGGEEDGGGADWNAQPSDKWNTAPKETKANFKTPEEFAAFLRVWARDKYAKTHGLKTLGQAEQDRLFAEFYRICVRKELQDLADKLLAPKMMNDKGELVTNQRLAKVGSGARVWVNRRIADLEKGMRPDTIERASADIFAFINKAAIRVSRVDLMTTFKKDLRERFLEGAHFDELKLDTERKLTGWLEEATRYIIHVCDLSRKSVNGDPSQLEQEYRTLHEIIDTRAKIYDDSGRETADAAKEDAETRRAQWKLALLDKYGAMRSKMPGEILDLRNDAFAYLEGEAQKLEDSWKQTREEQDRIRRDFSAAIEGPGDQRYDEQKNRPWGWISNHFLDSLNGMIRLRLEHLTRFASAEKRAKAKDAINSIMVMLGDGEVAYTKALQSDREAFFAGLAEIFKRDDGKPDNKAIKKYLERMDEPIPVELSRQLSNQGFAESMTYGQMLQLLVSLEQKSFRDTIEQNGREGQAELIRTFRYRDEDGNAVNAFTKEDDAFVDMLRAFYAAKRDQLSEVTERMVGQKVDSPDPLYCPIRRWMDDKARDLHADPTQRWDPISKIFSRRVPSLRDFDESRTIVGLFFENSKESAKLTAWAERGSFIRNVVTSVGFQASVKRAFGPGELSKILKQLEATFNGGEQRSQTPGEVAAADKAVNFVTYAYLGFNPLSALKQTTSFAVWANQLPNGFTDLWRHMTHFDKATLKHLMESDEYKVRYGNAVGSGMDYATKGVNMNPSQNPVSRALAGAGMWMLKRGDFLPGGWIAQGVYKDLLDKHMREGMEYAEADRLAITETFNMLEETQQSGRTYNTNMLQIEHGRIGRLLTQFATSPLQQLQYETQALREWRDMVRYNMGKERIAEARAKFRRAVVINHVIMPAALNLVIAMYKAAIGEEPPWEKDGYHWSLLIDVLLGQFSRVFFLGAFAQTTLTALFKRETPRTGQVLPIEGALGMGTSAAFLLHDLATMDMDKVQKDIERAMKATAPTRIPYNLGRRILGDSDQDRKRKKRTGK